MSQAMSVRIGPSFFAKELREYCDWRWAYIREAAQNGFDAPGSSRLEFIVESYDGNTRVSFQNDGGPMDEETLVGKLLTMGESGKNFESGATGGFGKAKLLLMFAQQSWSVRTGTLLVEGVGGDYTLTRGLEHYAGTRTEVLVKGDEVESLCNALRRFCSLAQWSGEVYLNGERLETCLRKGKPRREFEWAKVYTNRQFENKVVVRINGTPMFVRTTSYKGCVIVELTGDSGQRLSANRDSLLYRIGCELDAFLSQLSVDKRSALRKQEAEIKRYEGERLKYEAAQPKKAGALLEILASEANADQGVPMQLAAFVRGGDARVEAGIETIVKSREDVAVSIGPEFYLKNTTGMAVPDYYTPGPSFSSYSAKLVRAWAACLLEMHKILEISAEFSVGFVLDEESAAEYSNGPEGIVYYLNPAKVVCQRDKTQCRSFRAAYTGAWADRFAIISVAAHEIVHGMGYDQHDEQYSSKYTDVMGTVLANLGRLTPLFRG